MIKCGVEKKVESLNTITLSLLSVCGVWFTFIYTSSFLTKAFIALITSQTHPNTIQEDALFFCFFTPGHLNTHCIHLFSNPISSLPLSSPLARFPQV